MHSYLPFRRAAWLHPPWRVNNPPQVGNLPHIPGLVELAAVLESVGGFDRPHAEPVVGGIASRTPLDDHMVADFERSSAHALLGELASRAPLNRPADRRTVGV